MRSIPSVILYTVLYVFRVLLKGRYCKYVTNKDTYISYSSCEHTLIPSTHLTMGHEILSAGYNAVINGLRFSVIIFDNGERCMRFPYTVCMCNVHTIWFPTTKFYSNPEKGFYPKLRGQFCTPLCTLILFGMIA